MSMLQTQDVTETAVEEVVDSTDRGVAEISQFRLMARRFKKSKLSVFALIVLAFMYVIMLFAPFFMTNEALEISADAKNAPPTKLTFDGGLKMCRPVQVLNQEDLSYQYTSNCSDKSTLVPVHIFGKGYEYKLITEGKETKLHKRIDEAMALGFVPVTMITMGEHIVVMEKESAIKQ